MFKYSILNQNDASQLNAFLGQFKSTSLFLLGNLERAGIEDHGEPYQGCWFGARDASGQLVGVATHFWNHNLILQCPEHACLPDLLDALRGASSRPIEGLVGPWPQITLAAHHLDIDLEACDYARKEPLFELDVGALIDPCAHDELLVTRLATRHDLELITDWRIAYNLRLTQSSPPRQEVARALMRSIQTQDIWVLVDPHTSRLLSMSGNNTTFAGTTFQIGGVWTPEHLRGQGHARRVVAGQIKAMAARGYTHAILFTGEDNIAAQRTYIALGFARTESYGLILGISP